MSENTELRPLPKIHISKLCVFGQWRPKHKQVAFKSERVPHAHSNKGLVVVFKPRCFSLADCCASQHYCCHCVRDHLSNCARTMPLRLSFKSCPFQPNRGAYQRRGCSDESVNLHFSSWIQRGLNKGAYQRRGCCGQGVIVTLSLRGVVMRPRPWQQCDWPKWRLVTAWKLDTTSRRTASHHTSSVFCITHLF